MKTTLDLPDDLMRRVKIRALQKNQKLQETVTELLEKGMQYNASDATLRQLPKPVRLKKKGTLKINDIESAIIRGREL